MAIEHDAGKKVAMVMIGWATFSNEDMEDDDGPDEGWYVDVDTGKIAGGIGPDFYGPGYKTLDEALAAVKKWATGRGLKVNTETFFLDVFQNVGGEGTVSARDG